MKSPLIAVVKDLKKSKVRLKVKSRIGEFKALGKKSNNELFKELCFCILTANFQAEKSIKIQKEIGKGLLALPEKKLAAKLKTAGHRFPNVRAKYIVEARKHKGKLKGALRIKNTGKVRDWLIKNVKGLGYKEASHFLRNVGRCNCAIIDFHIIDALVRYGVITRPKSLNSKAYLSIEKVLGNLAKKLKLNQAELDLYLWHLETGKVLK